MKKPAVILLTVVLPVAALADWTGTTSTQFDLADNWGGALPTNPFYTTTARLDGYGTTNGTTPPPGVGWPVIDSAVNVQWDIIRSRGPGLHLTQTGGTVEWMNGSGVSTRGINLFSRPVNYANTASDPNDPAHPTLWRLTGGTMIADALGLGTTTSTTYYNNGGDYTEDTLTYKNWQTTPGDNAYGWGRLELRGGTFIVRPNRWAYPTGYYETNNPYWVYYETNDPSGGPYSARSYDIAISTNSQMVISDNGTLVAPLPIYLEDKDLVTQLKYYAGLIQAGSPPHYVPNGALSGPRLVAGPGQTLQFDSFPLTNDVNEVWGGYFTVTAVPAPFAGLQQIGASSLAVSGLVGRDYQIESTDELTQPTAWNVRTNFTLATSPQTWNDPTPSSSNRFYRAVLLPLP